MKVFGITAPMTGSGKTTVTLAFLSRLKNSTGFKIGPDYIDGGLSSRVTGNRTWNIDRWIQGKAYSSVLAGAASKYDYGVVEGVMGLYDSGSPINMSTYYYFRKFSIPYVLVIDVSKLAESAYYIAKSFITRFTLGVVINRYASQRHLEMVSKPFTEHGIPIIGAIPREDRFTVPERHLGLHTGQEMDDILEKASLVSNYLEMEFIENLPEREFQQPSPARISGGGKKIWIALDRAFNFYYADSIWALERIGNVNYFSPVSGEYPENPDMVYFGGGYPELYAPELSANHALSGMIRDYSESGGNIIAECGGLMYLEKEMETESGVYSLGAPGIVTVCAGSSDCVLWQRKEQNSGLATSGCRYRDRNNHGLLRTLQNARYSPAAECDHWCHILYRGSHNRGCNRSPGLPGCHNEDLSLQLTILILDFFS